MIEIHYKGVVSTERGGLTLPKEGFVAQANRENRLHRLLRLVLEASVVRHFLREEAVAHVLLRLQVTSTRAVLSRQLWLWINHMCGHDWVTLLCKHWFLHVASQVRLTCAQVVPHNLLNFLLAARTAHC